jgi:hypothetical protein
MNTFKVDKHNKDINYKLIKDNEKDNKLLPQLRPSLPENHFLWLFYALNIQRHNQTQNQIFFVSIKHSPTLF